MHPFIDLRIYVAVLIFESLSTGVSSRLLPPPRSHLSSDNLSSSSHEADPSTAGYDSVEGQVDWKDNRVNQEDDDKDLGDEEDWGDFTG